MNLKIHVLSDHPFGVLYKMLPLTDRYTATTTYIPFFIKTEGLGGSDGRLNLEVSTSMGLLH